MLHFSFYFLDAAIPAYLLGSIPFGLMLTRLAGLGDIRKTGSGNIGATNVMRTGRKGLGVLTLLLDGGKGFVAVYIAQLLLHADLAAIAGLSAVLGHIFPVWLRFKGGKGVATAIGVMFALNGLLGFIVCGLWLMMFALTRTSSAASLGAIGYAWAAAWLMEDYSTAMLCLVLAVLILYTHRTNIRRLLQGMEHSFASGSGV